MTKFLVLGNINAITYNGVFNEVRDKRCWFGYTKPTTFDVLPDFEFRTQQTFTEDGKRTV